MAYVTDIYILDLLQLDVGVGNLAKFCHWNILYLFCEYLIVWLYTSDFALLSDLHFRWFIICLLYTDLATEL